MTTIEEDSIKKYVQSVRAGLSYTILAILVIEIVQCLCLKVLKSSGSEFNTFLFLQGRWDINIDYVKRHLIIPNLLNFSLYTMFSIVNTKKLSSQFLCVIELYTYAVVYSFGHWGFIYMSMVYCMPVLLSCPFQRNCLKFSFVIGIISAIVYTIYQYSILPSIYHFYILSISLMSIYVSFLIADAISKVYHNIIEMNNQLKNDAYTDNLVGLRNKNCYLKDVSTMEHVTAIAFIDIDNFKHINDNYGHDTGDKFLINLSKFLKKLPDNCVTYRFGGDEFVVFSFEGSDNSIGQLEQSLKFINDAFFKSCKREYGIGTTLSIGIIDVKDYCDEYNSIKDLILKSDSLLYEAKKNKNTVVVLSKDNNNNRSDTIWA